MDVTVPTNFPAGDRRTHRVVLVDRDGDVWRQVGVTPEGEPHMVCEAPQDPSEVGPGESNPWTPKAIRAWFSPVRTLGGAA
ncbi:hypothetical protein [Nocardioides sp. NPDC006273]|uniref:hypothetical protein n=1 Tax=Actinomycetes TaxID=1760 RepID=UPI0033B54120